MADLSELETEIKGIIIESLMLEDVTPAEIVSEDPLFETGLGLDSIDALELAMALEEHFGVAIEDDPEKNEQLFSSVTSLASFVDANRSK